MTDDRNEPELVHEEDVGGGCPELDMTVLSYAFPGRDDVAEVNVFFHEDETVATLITPGGASFDPRPEDFPGHGVELPECGSKEDAPRLARAVVELMDAMGGDPFEGITIEFADDDEEEDE
jgi:hypothetical protein